jgi:DNA-binding Lrp family transcriptional regulator
MSNGGAVHEHEYDGVHAFAFIHDPAGKKPEDIVRDVRALGRPRVFYASTFVGDYAAFVHVSASKLARLQDLIDGPLWEAGVHTAYKVESGVYVGATGEAGVKRKSPGLIAIVKMKVRGNRIDQAVQELGDLGDSIGFVGASTVTGEHDILLQLTGESIDDVKANLASAVSQVEGIVKTSTAFADGDRTDGRYGEIPEVNVEEW